MIKDAVKGILKAKGMTQSDLAKKLGISQETISRQIGGNPTLKTITDIANALDVDIRELFRPTKGGELLNGFVQYKDKVYVINNRKDLESLLEKLNTQTNYTKLD
ncbi:helix-turn-helix domain-containing protein [Flagellimonas allohymeniacidonis]|uniref:XRE family transcriptional regulator n=1 Tax=Flagellimonas allohymeniacidonis TaxID=2517819 RepID=A0A4Q8QEU2_9FLAO|nr:helix-turn-helix transcriptional regulator [Allomuricauda hymeniacidonis]TAI48985.1 XRE family transcriptional regulator [Allomuricauda hymeniacidonis]